MGGSAVRLSMAIGIAMVCVSGPIVSAQSVAVGEPIKTATPARITITVVDAPFLDVLHAIARQAGLRIFLGQKMYDQTKRVSLSLRGVTVEDAFAGALVGTGLRAVITSGNVAFSDDVTVASVAQGSVTGKVVDAKTRHGVRGATVTLMGTNKGTTSNEDGSFRIASVVPGSYTVQVRLLGYVKTTKSVTVTEGQATSVEITVEPSVNALDQVVVTGSVIPTELRAVPNAMTVITAKEIEQRGVTQISQLFRGDVPGLYAQNRGASSDVDQATITSRGSTVMGASSTTTQPPIKTYLDGIELADATYLNQIDPRSIDRIEILTGPQAATIYGGNAINGVIQIFTKRGRESVRPRLTLNLLSGLLQNDFSPAYTPQHDYTAQLDGTEGRLSYNAGGTWNYEGAWSAGKRTTRLTTFGGARMQFGRFTGDAIMRVGNTVNRQVGDGQEGAEFGYTTGLYKAQGYKYNNKPRVQTLAGQTFGVTLGYDLASWWTFETGVGVDRSDYQYQQKTAMYTYLDDTTGVLVVNTNRRTSVRASTTARISLTDRLRWTTTVGGDGWNNLITGLSGFPVSLTGSSISAPSWIITRTPGHNAGGFIQSQVGVMDAVFFTYGLRAEWNPGYGEEQVPNLAPRYGIAMARDLDTRLGAITFKVRASYGRSTRPPRDGLKDAQQATDASFSALFGAITTRLGNPDLLPERQQGGEGGLELYFGSRGSLILTRYNQTVDDLIFTVTGVDSAKSIAPNSVVTCSSWGPVTDDYCYFRQTQSVNLGSIRNSGWEGQGTFSLGPLTAKGTYSFSKSRVLGITPRYRALAPTTADYQPGAIFGYIPEHTWGLGISFGRAATSVSLNINGTSQIYKSWSERGVWHRQVSQQIRLQENRIRMGTGASRVIVPGYALADINMTHRFSTMVEGVLQVRNLTNTYRNDGNDSYAVLGRQSKAGFRVRW